MTSAPAPWASEHPGTEASVAPAGAGAAPPATSGAEGVGTADFVEVTRVLFATPNPEALPQAIVEAASRVMRAEAVTLLLPRGDGSLYIAYATGMPPEIQKATRVVVGQGLAGQVAESRQPRLLSGTVEGGHGRSRSSILYPLVSVERLIGLCTFNRRADQPPYREQDLGVASMLASLFLLALENSRLAQQTTMAEKLAAVGQLSAGIAHEINTPVQFVGDSVHFARGALEDLFRLLGKYREIGAALVTASEGPDSADSAGALLEQARQLEEEVEIDFLAEELPKAIERSLEGVRRVAEIVHAVKTFGRAEQREKQVADVNQLIQTTLVVARPEYRHVADVTLELGDVPPLLCHPGDLSQVFLNLIVNASHAMGDVHKRNGERGQLILRTGLHSGAVQVAISDTGGGIPRAIATRVFDPFFTTKEVGKGTGLGLSIARTLIVDKHGGTLTFDSEEGKGTTFWIRLPVEDLGAGEGEP